jgi:hypothetical protein
MLSKLFHHWDGGLDQVAYLASMRPYIQIPAPPKENKFIIESSQTGEVHYKTSVRAKDNCFHTDFCCHSEVGR